MGRDDRVVVGLLGYFGDANLGDEAGPAALVHHLGKRIPGVQFVLFSRSADDSRRRFGLPSHLVSRPPPAYGTDGAHGRGGSAPDGQPRRRSAWLTWLRAVGPLRATVRVARAVRRLVTDLPAEARFLWRASHQLRGMDLLIVAGSGPVFDLFGGFPRYPYTLLKWALLARLTKTRLAFASVGAGPIRSRVSALFLRWALRLGDYVSFRDIASRQTMSRHGFHNDALVYPDLAHSLPLPRATPRRELASSLVGMNLMPLFRPDYWPDADPERYQRYVNMLAVLAADLVADGSRVLLYGTQKDDYQTLQDLRAAMRVLNPALTPAEIVMPETVEGLLELSLSVDFVVATRFHAAVFALMAARPTIAIGYHPKSQEMLEAAGLGEFVLDVEHVTAADLRAAFSRLDARRAQIAAVLERHAAKVRARLDVQYDDLTRLTRPGTAASSSTPMPPLP